MIYTVYTDGACSGNPGPGGYSAIFLAGDKEIMHISGSRSNTTNNCMELMAIVRSIKHILKGEEHAKSGIINIYSDSAYCINSITQGWYKFWAKNDWKTRDGQEVKNKELWEELNGLLTSTKRFKFFFQKVPGHSGVHWNEEADRLAKEAMKKRLDGGNKDAGSI